MRYVSKMKRYAPYEERTRKLAAKGYLRSVIAKKLDVSIDTVTAICKFYKIPYKLQDGRFSTVPSTDVPK